MYYYNELAHILTFFGISTNPICALEIEKIALSTLYFFLKLNFFDYLRGGLLNCNSS